MDETRQNQPDIWRFSPRNIIFKRLAANNNRGFEMTKSYSAILILILLLTGTAASQSTGELGSYTTGSGLMGQVVDASGSGISGAGIWIIGGEGQAVNTATNATGYYGMSVTPGNYTIASELSGYSFTSSPVQVWSGAVSMVPRITGYAADSVPPTSMAPTAPAATTGFYQYGLPYAQGSVGWVQGRVTDRSGIGIPYASIAVDGFMSASATDENGNYRIALSPGMHRIDPMSPGYGIPPRAALITSGQTTNLDITARMMSALGKNKNYY
jgi:hypothetical protein